MCKQLKEGIKKVVIIGFYFKNLRWSPFSESINNFGFTNKKTILVNGLLFLFNFYLFS